MEKYLDKRNNTFPQFFFLVDNQAAVTVKNSPSNDHIADVR